MPENFKWKCLFLDDNPLGVQGHKDSLLELGILCDVLGGAPLTMEPALTFLAKNHFSEITNNHIIFIDMKWEELQGNRNKNIIITPGEIYNQKDFLEWIEKFYNCGVGNIIQIQENHIGFWLSAAISHVNPQADIVLYTAASNPREESVPAALSSFFDAPYRIWYKRTETINLNDFLPRLEQLQRRCLESNTEVREWFIGGVLIPCLLNEKPIYGDVDQVMEGDARNDKWRLYAESFFPQIKEVELDRPAQPGESVECGELSPHYSKSTISVGKLNDLDRQELSHKKKLDFLLRFVEKNKFELSLPQKRALKAVKHSLEKLQVKIKNKENLTANHFNESRDRCLDAGLAGQRVLLEIIELQKSIKERIKKPSLDEIENIISIANKSLNNDIDQLAEFCEVMHNGIFDCDIALAKDPCITNQGEKKLPFDITHLKQSVSALFDNLDNLYNQEKLEITPTKSGKSSKHKVLSYWTLNYLSVVYIDNSFGFSHIKKKDNIANTQNSLSDVVIQSLKKDGFHRGLPLALSFPFFYPISSLEVMTNDNKWHKLFPLSELDFSDEVKVHISKFQQYITDEYTFGFRWIFTIDS